MIDLAFELYAGSPGGDCNDNGIPDDCDLLAATSDDENSNGIPDECECTTNSDCADVSVCTENVCDPGAPGADAAGCVRDFLALEGTSCDDGDACTTDDECAAGSCIGTALPNCPSGDDGSDGGGGGGGGTTSEPTAPTNSGVVDPDGHAVVEVASDDGATKGSVEVTGGAPGADVTLTLHMNDGEPGLPRAAKFGFADERVLGSTLEVTSTLVPGTFAATVRLVVQQGAVESLALELAEVDLHVMDETLDSSNWARAGTTFLGNSPPTEDERDYGYNIHDNGTVSYWAVVDQFSAFAVGQSESGPSTCDDGVFCNGQEATDVLGRCESGAPPCDLSECCDESAGSCVSSGKCFSDDDCDNGTFCDGAEVCVGGCCQTGSMPCGSGDCCEDTDGCELCPCVTDAHCPDDLCCDTPSRACVECPCLSDSNCPDDGEFCTGPETCVDGECISKGDPCESNERCDEIEDTCIADPPIDNPLPPSGGLCGVMGSGCRPTGPAMIMMLLGLVGLRFVAPSRKRQ